MFHFRPLHPLIDGMTMKYYLSYDTSCIISINFERIRIIEPFQHVRKKVECTNRELLCYEVFSCSTSQVPALEIGMGQRNPPDVAPGRPRQLTIYVLVPLGSSNAQITQPLDHSRLV